MHTYIYTYMHTYIHTFMYVEYISIKCHHTVTVTILVLLSVQYSNYSVCGCMCVCVYVCMCVYMYVCMYVCMYVYMYVCCMYVCMYVCVYACVIAVQSLSVNKLIRTNRTTNKKTIAGCHDMIGCSELQQSYIIIDTPNRLLLLGYQVT